MRNKLLTCAIIATASLGLGISAQAASKCWPWDVECKVKEAIEDVETAKTNPSLSVLCRKGLAKEAIFSMRSFKGALCTGQFYLPEPLTLLVAGFAESVCDIIADDYKTSECHQKAEAYLKSKNLEPNEAIKKGVDEGTGKIVGLLKAGFCLLKDNIPGSSLICGGDKEDKPEKVEESK